MNDPAEDQGQPIPQGNYVPAVRHAGIIYTSGMTPRKAGVLQFEGRIRAEDPLETHQEAVELATLNAVTAVKAKLAEGEQVAVVLQLNVFLNAEEGFTAHAKMANYASNLLIEHFGANCIGSRAAIGVATLPSNAPVEVTLVAAIG